MSDAIARQPLFGQPLLIKPMSARTAISLFAIAVIAAAAATPADALRIRVRPGSSSTSDSKSTDTANVQADSSESAASPSAAAPDSAPATASVTPTDGPSNDERTQKILAEENRGTGKLHPLQTSEPNYNIVVCEAGCGDAKPHVIYRRPVAAVRSASAESATPSSSPSKSVECRGGCDGGVSDRTGSIMGAKPGLLNDDTGSWMTTVTPKAPKAAVAPPVTDVKPQASKANREDWMARINRERAADKDKPAAEPETNSPSEMMVPEPGPIKEGNPVSD